MTFTVIDSDDILLTSLLGWPTEGWDTSGYFQSPMCPWFVDPIFMFLMNVSWGRRFYTREQHDYNRNLALKPPFNIPYDRDFDWNTYGTIPGLIGSLTSFSFNNEKFKDNRVIHPTLDGVYYPSIVESSVEKTYSNTYGSTLPYTAMANEFVSFDSLSSSINDQENFSLNANELFTDTRSAIEYFFNNTINLGSYSTHRRSGSNNYYGAARELYSLSGSLNQDGLWEFPFEGNPSFNGHYQIKVAWYFSHPPTNKKRVEYDADVTLSVIPTEFSQLDEHIKGYYVSYQTEITRVIENDTSGIYAPWVGKSFAFTGKLPTKVLGHVSAPELSSDERVIQVVDASTRLENMIDRHFQVISGSAVASTLEAYDSFKNWAGTNLVESLSELDQVLSLMDFNSKEVLKDKIHRTLNTPGVPLSRAAKNVIDFLTSGILLYNFGIKPLIGDAEVIADVMSKSADDLRTGLRGRYHGKSIFNITVGGLPATLVTRSHIDVRVPNEHMLTYLLPLSRVGLEASLSTLWDLVPFSFVVDWFFNIGSRLDYANTGLHMLVGHVPRFHHSYTLYIDTEYTSLTGIGQYTYYRRENSKFFPHPKPASMNFHDWLGQTRVPPVLAGSLLWQFLN